MIIFCVTSWLSRTLNILLCIITTCIPINLWLLFNLQHNYASDNTLPDIYASSRVKQLQENAHVNLPFPNCNPKYFHIFICHHLRRNYESHIQFVYHKNLSFYFIKIYFWMLKVLLFQDTWLYFQNNHFSIFFCIFMFCYFIWIWLWLLCILSLWEFIWRWSLCFLYSPFSIEKLDVTINDSI